MICHLTSRHRLVVGLGVLFAALLSACGTSRSLSDQLDVVAPVTDASPGDSSPEIAGADVPVNHRAEAVFEPAGRPGRAPFTLSVSTVPATAAETTAPGLYGGSGDNVVCDVELLIEFLTDDPAKAAAWAEASDIAVTEIPEYLASLEPTVLDADTPVTNHGYRGGRANPFQAILAAGTAVLVDDAGVPRARCACGNPLDEPRHTAGDVPSVDEQTVMPTGAVPGIARPGTDEQPPGSGANGFCAVWSEVSASIVGGPTDGSPAGIDAYLDRMVYAFTELVAAGRATPDFPVDALTDLDSYLDDLTVAAASDGAPAGGDVELRDRVEGFIVERCGEGAGSDPGEEIDGDSSELDPPTSADCGSMQFFLLVAAAEGLGIDHAAVSAPVFEALDELLAGIDPGPAFDVTDVDPMLSYEEIGCQGATRMRQLFADAGLAEVIEGTELGA